MLYQRVTTLGDALWSHRIIRDARDVGDDPMDLSEVVMMKTNGRRYAGYQNKTSPIRQSKCYKCGKPGHFQRDCRSKSLNTIQPPEDDSGDVPDGSDFQ